MTGPPNTVEVACSRGAVTIPRSSRDELLAQIKHLHSADGVRSAFDAAGAPAPVKLAAADKELLIEVINVWMQSVGRDDLPDGIFDLRNALYDDMHDAGAGP